MNCKPFELAVITAGGCNGAYHNVLVEIIKQAPSNCHFHLPNGVFHAPVGGDNRRWVIKCVVGTFPHAQGDSKFGVGLDSGMRMI